MQTKDMSFAVKAAGESDGLSEGQIVAYASVFDNVDSYGDRMVKGAFANTLVEWKESGRTIPLLFGHNMTDPMMNIGAVLNAEEDDRGLKITAQFDLDQQVSAQVYRLVKSRRLSELSFAFDVVNSKDAEGVRELTEVKLYECSIVPIGANPETEIIAVKTTADVLRSAAVDLKAGRTISSANETKLRDSIDMLETAVAAIKGVLPPLEDDQKSSSTQEQSSGHGPTAEAPHSESAAKSGFNPSDPLVVQFEFISTPEEES